MSKLHQVLAVVSSKKTESTAGLSDLYKKIQKPALFSGLSRTYESLDENGEVLPPESTKVQLKSGEVIREFQRIVKDTLDVVATQDYANRDAVADVVVDGKTLLKNVPATYLIWLEKRLTDFNTFVSHLPVLDPAEDWQFDPGTRLYKTSVLKKNRTKKTPKVIVKYQATEQHPAQTELFQEDVLVGRWNEVKMSGAITESEKLDLTDRVRKLLDSVKVAREEANQIEAPSVKVADDLFSYIFGESR